MDDVPPAYELLAFRNAAYAPEQRDRLARACVPGQRIVLFGVNGYSGNLQYPVDRTLTLAQAADKFQTLSSDASLLVARIDGSGQCQPLVARNASTPRATASIFKLWVLAALAQATPPHAVPAMAPT